MICENAVQAGRRWEARVKGSTERLAGEALPGRPDDGSF